METVVAFLCALSDILTFIDMQFRMAGFWQVSEATEARFRMSTLSVGAMQETCPVGERVHAQ